MVPTNPGGDAEGAPVVGVCCHTADFEIEYSVGLNAHSTLASFDLTIALTTVICAPSRLLEPVVTELEGFGENGVAVGCDDGPVHLSG